MFYKPTLLKLPSTKLQTQLANNVSEINLEQPPAKDPNIFLGLVGGDQTRDERIENGNYIQQLDTNMALNEC